jgi:glutaredoxin 3
MVKDFLSQKGVGYKEKDVSVDQAAAQEMVSKTGQRGVPVTVIDSETIVGFDRARLEEALKKHRTTPRPDFGISVADASKITAQRGTGVTLGAYVGKVRENSAAAKIGLHSNDIIIEVNMQNIANASVLEQTLGKLKAGSRVAVVFLRDNRQLSAEGVY